MKGTALVMSPHLDDAAFSCGGTMAMLADAGWRVVMVTAFTRSVLPVEGFALACVLDKGLPGTVDYMALRRAEDEVAAGLLGVEARWLDMLEAPHRGYESAPALFGPAVAGDDAWRELAGHVRALLRELQPALVLAPQGLGSHIDHRQMIRAVREAGAERVGWYRDTPYAIRNAAALPDPALQGLAGVMVNVGPGLERKVAASCAYESQVGFQFGSAAAAAVALRAFSASEGQGGVQGEQFLGTIPANLV